MRVLKKLVCGALTASMLAASGCSGGDLSWSHRVGDAVLPIGAYIYIEIEAVSAANEALEEEHAGEEGYTTPDTFKKLLDETVGGQPVAEYVLEAADRQAREFFAIEREFEERGLTLTAAEIAYATSTTLSTMEQTPALFEDNGIAESSMRMILENGVKRQQIFLDTYGEGGEKAVSEQELKDYFAENYAYTDMMFFMKSAQTEEGAEDTGKASAEEFLQMLNDGTDFYEAVYQSNRAQAEQSGEDPESVERPEANSQTGIIENSESMRSTYGDEFIDGLFSAEIGKPVIVDGEGLYYVFNRRDVLEDDSLYLDNRQELLVSLKSEEFIALVDEWAAEVTPERNSAAIEKYRPEKLKLS